MSFKTAKNANIKIWIKVILGIIKFTETIKMPFSAVA